eukprot:TRINITY_DN34142_c0_g1_i1.p2 TRINITY_DN34142_c0_g1~~TRINITY_DN34142_c0_g1_i1.p2  ORF type:complete len:141 (-),score=25.15 TRINITY_DN34142_c0_g1_i1:68-490(-)
MSTYRSRKKKRVEECAKVLSSMIDYIEFSDRLQKDAEWDQAEAEVEQAFNENTNIEPPSEPAVSQNNDSPYASRILGLAEAHQSVMNGIQEAILMTLGIQDLTQIVESTNTMQLPLEGTESPPPNRASRSVTPDAQRWRS